MLLSLRHHPVRFLAYLCAVVPLLLAGCAQSTTATTTSGQLTLAGSTALQPLAAKSAQLFHQRYPNANVDVYIGGSLNGLRAVAFPNNAADPPDWTQIKHNNSADPLKPEANPAQIDPKNVVDIGNSDVYADPAEFPDPALTDSVVCVIPFALVVNKKVTGVSSLTTEQITKIYSTKEITNWKDVGGPDLPIQPVVRPASSGTRANFRRFVLNGRDEIIPPLKSDSSSLVHDTVRDTDGAIGYLALPYIDNQVTVIGIDGVAVSRDSIASGSYKFWGFEHMYTLDTNPNPLIPLFLSFMLSDTVQQQAQTLGYLPVSVVRSIGRAPGSHPQIAGIQPVEVRR